MEEIKELYHKRKENIILALVFSIFLLVSLVGCILSAFYANCVFIGICSCVVGVTSVLSPASIICAISFDNDIKKKVLESKAPNKKKLG